ncbi:MAG: crotonobetainyl-CoA:carnitine CoA-transferase CaiB-like acyl-CoA transferase [Acidimicrobiales bacterium]|jgi:crotonobetainyl-CoA:carnitine CoA-transferase CaiB-like acyl-CoA transferase
MTDLAGSVGSGPLAGLRVVDLTGDIGRFGSKLLTEFGAAVVRSVGGSEHGADMLDAAADAQGGVLDWWFDGGKHSADLDLDSEAGRQNYRQLAQRADVVIESERPGRLTALGLDHADLVSVNPSLTQVSLTPYGRTGPWAQWESSDLVAAALGGVMAVTGLPDQPLNSYGGQNHNFGGFAAAITALAGVRSARRTGQGQLIDLSLHEVVTGSIENLFFQYFYDDHLPLPKEAKRQGSLHWLGAYEVVPAASGYVMITPTPQAEQLIDWMVEVGIESAAPFVGMPVEQLLGDMPRLMASVKELLLTGDAGPMFTEAQHRHIAFGEVQTVAQAAENPQYLHRGLYDEVAIAGGTDVKLPSRLVRFGGTPVGPPAPPKPTAESVAEILADWPVRDPPAPTSTVGSKPLEGVRVLDLSWVLAGPFATRILGDLGADVIKVQHEARSTLVNQPDYPYYAVWNRSKRSAAIDLKHPEALEVVRKLVEQADVLVENYSSGVLDRLGLGFETVRQWNPKLVYVSMSGPGHTGPWKDVISYAPTIHALCGLTHLTNPVGRGDVGCGFSLNDHAAGFASALSTLAALEAVERTGEGQLIDMAQLEIGTYILGPAMLDFFTNGREAQPNGNVDGLADRVPNEVYASLDGFVAVTANNDEMWARLAPLVEADPSLTAVSRRDQRDAINDAVASWVAARSSVDAMTMLQGAGVAAGQVQNAAELFHRDPQHQARAFWETGSHDIYGERPHDRFPALFSDSVLEPYLLAPAFLGEANFEVWTEVAGIEAEAVAEGIGTGLFT